MSITWIISRSHRIAILTGVGVGDFVDFVGVEPDLTLAAVEDGSSQTFLGAQVDPTFAKQILMSKSLLLPPLFQKKRLSHIPFVSSCLFFSTTGCIHTQWHLSPTCCVAHIVALQ